MLRVTQDMRLERLAAGSFHLFVEALLHLLSLTVKLD